MNFKDILRALSNVPKNNLSSEDLRAVMKNLASQSKLELKRLSELQADLEHPAVVFERWALPPNRGVKHELENSKTLKYGDVHLNAANIGFMQCYAWLQPQIEALQAKEAAGVNTPDVLQNDKINVHFVKLGEVSKIDADNSATTTDEGVKYDQGKARMDLLDPYAMEQLSLVLTFGAKKYAAHNWRKGIDSTRLIAAALRHIFSLLNGEDKDPETGLSHASHAMCCCMFLVWTLEFKPEFDDRVKL